MPDFVVRANQQQIERVALVAEDETQVQADPKFVESAAQFAQGKMGMRLAKGFHQSGKGVEHLILDRRPQRFEHAVVAPRRFDSHCDLPRRVRFARACAA